MPTKIEAHRQNITGIPAPAGPHQPIPRIVRTPVTAVKAPERNAQARPTVTRS